MVYSSHTDFWKCSRKFYIIVILIEALEHVVALDIFGYIALAWLDTWEAYYCFGGPAATLYLEYRTMVWEVHKLYLFLDVLWILNI